jgi:hypothetical protein
MSVIALLAIESRVLSDALDAEPGVSLTLVQETLPADRPARLIFWIEGDDHADFEAVLREDDTIADVVHLARTESRTLYRVDVADECVNEITYPTLTDLDIALLDAEADSRGWRVRLQAPDRTSLQHYIDYCRKNDIPVTVRQLYTQNDDDADETRLTPGQREVLELALSEGYFQIPRDVTTHELGDRLGISGQAVSERLRRGLHKSVTQTIEQDFDDST